MVILADYNIDIKRLGSLTLRITRGISPEILGKLVTQIANDRCHLLFKKRTIRKFGVVKRVSRFEIFSLSLSVSGVLSQLQQEEA